MPDFQGVYYHSRSLLNNIDSMQTQQRRLSNPRYKRPKAIIISIVILLLFYLSLGPLMDFTEAVYFLSTLVQLLPDQC